MISRNKKSVGWILRYTFFLAIFFWVLISIYVGYKYVWTSVAVNTKGGTFVEGIFGNTSYLPYLRSDHQSLFYQGILFNGCLKPAYEKNGIAYYPDMCKVTTKDNQTYSVELNKGFIRSDGTPVSLEDIFFTYNDILHGNTWQIPALGQYQEVIVTKDVNNKLKVSFPTKSVDNILFFSNYILPQHIVAGYDLNDYKSLFAFKPVYTNCANLVPQSTDQYSLIFNLVNCADTNLNFYQIKNTTSFDTFKSSVKNWEKSIIDAYVWDIWLPWYDTQKIETNQLIMVFFNTHSSFLKVRGRRALGGLIKHNFYTPGYEAFFKKNTDGLFDVFQSSGWNVKELLNREYSQDTITKNDLIDMDVKVLSSQVAVKWTDQKLVYFIETWVQHKINLSFDTPYDKIAIEYKWKLFYPSDYTKKGMQASYTIWWASNNFWSGVNKYIIYGFSKAGKNAIASLDIYNLIPSEEDAGNVEQTVTFTVVYYDNPINTFVVTRLKQIFAQNQLSGNFIFEKITTPQELQGRLTVGDYDLLINSIDMGMKKDITKLFSTDKSEVNPSQYQNPKLMTLLQQYNAADERNKKNSLWSINTIYAKDMPFVVLGKEYLQLHIKSSVKSLLLGTWAAPQFDEYNRRSYMYKNLKLVNNIHIDGKSVWSFDHFSDFLTTSLH